MSTISNDSDKSKYWTKKKLCALFVKKKKTPVTLYGKVQKFSKSNGASPHQNKQ
jgi:hypothetical protein